MGFIKGIIFAGICVGFAVYAHKQWPQQLDKAATFQWPQQQFEKVTKAVKDFLDSRK